MPSDADYIALKQRCEALERKLQDFITKTNERLFELQPLADTVRVSQGQQVKVVMPPTSLKINFGGINLKGPEIVVEGPITSPDELIFKTGDASIVMKKDGTITIKGKDITIRGSGKVDVRGDNDVVIKGKKVMEN